MRSRVISLAWLIAVATVLLISAACSNKEPTQSATAAPSSQPAAQPAAAPATQAAPAPAPAAQPAAAPPATSAPALPTGPVLASAQYTADPDLRCDLLEVKRVSGGALLVRWRIVNTAGQGQSGLTASQPKSVRYLFGWDDLYYIDPAENKKYQYLKDAENNRILDIFEGDLPAGQQRVNWAKFPAPPPSSNKISLTLPKFPPFEDVPVSQ